jgi:hypothetical protein
MSKIIRRSDRAEGGITKEEEARLKIHTDMWIQRAFRTEAIELSKIIPAIEGLYEVSGFKKPRVIIVDSPLIMAVAYGLAAAIWYHRNQNPNLDITLPIAMHNHTVDATDPVTSIATHIATRAATDDATRAATRSATLDATYAATYAATDNATRVATRDAMRAATEDATRAATLDVTRAATYAATYAATDDATRTATLDATRVATYAATYAATDDATDAATLDATRIATDDATRAMASHVIHQATDKTRNVIVDPINNAVEMPPGWARILVNQIAPHDLLLQQLMISCISRWWNNYQGGNIWAPYDCYLTATRDVLGLQLPIFKKYRYWEEAAIHGHLRVLHPEFCIVSNFPEILKVDDQNRPHASEGPSHKWRDGFSLYYWHGVRVTRQIIEAPETLTIAQIEQETNAEVRRVMIERYGLSKFLLDSNARKISEDDFGILYRKPVAGDEDIVMVKVVNSTAEPDGSFKDYFLRVPPDIKTAKQACAWTFGLSEKEYDLELQT